MKEIIQNHKKIIIRNDQKDDIWIIIIKYNLYNNIANYWIINLKIIHNK